MTKPNHDPMAIAAEALEQACDQVDQAANLDERLQFFFQDAQLQFGEEIDKRIAFNNWVKIQIEAAENAVMFYEQRIADLKTVHQRFKERTQAVVEAQPNLTFRGKLGKIWVQKNNPGVEYAFGGREVDPQTIEVFGVPEDYVKTKLVYTIDSEKLKADLTAGKKFLWATLRQTQSIRFPANRKAKQIEGSDENE